MLPGMSTAQHRPRFSRTLFRRFRIGRHCALPAMGAALAGCSGAHEWIEPFPHVRVDREARVVEFDARVAWDFHDPKEPITWLEQIICLPDSKDYESLGVTLASPSHVHAALLLAGFEAGSPGRWRLAGESIEVVPPEGDRVTIDLVVKDARGREVRASAFDWIIHEPTGRSMREVAKEKGWGFVFGGSRMRTFRGREVYDADHAGPFIGLMTFGNETISFSDVLSHEEAMQTPVFRVNPATAPAFGTLFRVRISPAPSGGS